METIKIQLEGLTCPSCVAKIEGALSKEKGVKKVKTLFHASKVKIEYNPNITDPEYLAQLISQLGYHVIPNTKAAL